jgi:hypothetical protein
MTGLECLFISKFWPRQGGVLAWVLEFFEFVEIIFEKNQIFTSWLEVSLMRINW